MIVNVNFIHFENFMMKFWNILEWPRISEIQSLQVIDYAKLENAVKTIKTEKI